MLLKDKLSNARRALFVLAAAILVVFEVFVFYKFAVNNGLIGADAERDVNVAVIHFDEPITPEYADRMIKRLEQIKERKDDYKRILMVYGSPGGSPTASHDLAVYFEKFQKELPITTYISDVAASGSYYIASTGEEILANPNAIVGSVGVLLNSYIAEKLGQKLGVSEFTLTSGEYKKPFSLLQGPTPEMEAYLTENMLTPVYNNFIHFVASRRGIPDEEFKQKYAGGRIFIASESVGVLVDRLATYYEVKQEIRDELEKAYPGEEIAFVDSTPREKKTPFSVSLDLNLDSSISSFLAEQVQNSAITLR